MLACSHYQTLVCCCQVCSGGYFSAVPPAWSIRSDPSRDDRCQQNDRARRGTHHHLQFVGMECRFQAACKAPAPEWRPVKPDGHSPMTPTMIIQFGESKPHSTRFPSESSLNRFHAGKFAEFAE